MLYPKIVNEMLGNMHPPMHQFASFCALLFLITIFSTATSEKVPEDENLRSDDKQPFVIRWAQPSQQKNTAASLSSDRAKRDGAHHPKVTHGHGAGGSFGFHGFGPHYVPPLIIEEASRKE